MPQPAPQSASQTASHPAPQTALLTGVGRSVGIAAGIARRLAADGWNLALAHWPAYDTRMPWGPQPDDTPALARELAGTGIRVTTHIANLEDPAAAPALLHEAIAAHGPLAALVLCHCESVDSTLLATSIESWDRHFAVNVRAALQLIQGFAAQCPATGGSVVALTSDALHGNVPYGASKAALDRLVLAAARELGPQNIRCNLLNPGPIDNGWMDDATRAACLAHQPTGRLGTPADIASTVSFLLSPAGAWISGQLLKVDGGFSA